MAFFDCYGNGAPSFYSDVISTDKKLQIIGLKERLESQRQWMENCGKQGLGKCTLLDFEMYDLPWLLERQEKNLSLPDFVQNEIEKEKFEVISAQEWIKRLKAQGTKLRRELRVSNMTCDELEYFIQLFERDNT